MLCAEAEAYVNQDYIPQREITTDRVDFLKAEIIKCLVEWQGSSLGVFMTKREKQIVRLLAKGLNRRDICELLEINENNYDIVIHRLKVKVTKM